MVSRLFSKLYNYQKHFSHALHQLYFCLLTFCLLYFWIFNLNIILPMSFLSASFYRPLNNALSILHVVTCVSISFSLFLNNIMLHG